MNVEKIEQLLEHEDSVFTRDVHHVIRATVERRRAIIDQIRDMIDAESDLSEVKFTAVLCTLRMMASDLPGTAGYAASFSVEALRAWLDSERHTRKPTATLRRPILLTILTAVGEHYTSALLEEEAKKVVRGGYISESVLMETAIGDLSTVGQLSRRTHNCLYENGVKTVGELCTKSRKELLNIRNFGKNSLHEVERFLGNFQLTLKNT